LCFQENYAYFSPKDDFSKEKTMKNKKSSEAELLSRLEPGYELLPPLVIRRRLPLDSGDRADARVELAWRDEPGVFPFVIEAKTQSTPLVVQSAITQARAMARGSELPMIFVPYLSPERLAELEQAGVSGVDLCGNGVVVVPGRLFVMRTGNSNCYRESRPLNNPYRGRSAMVARMLLMRPQWQSLKELLEAIKQAGTGLSLPQASKAVQAIENDLIVSKSAGIITLRDPLRLLDKLGKEWRKPLVRGRQALRLPPGKEFASVLSSNPLLKWAMTGESSVSRYVTFSQGGPRRIAVSSLPLALTLLGGTLEPVPSFADVELIETVDPGFFFANEVDPSGVRWASKLQTWLELQSGDARQQDAARDLRERILREVKA
jgi:hypothetical protein